MAQQLLRGMASALANGLRATPGLEPRIHQEFSRLLEELGRPTVTEPEAERRIAAWLATAPSHAVTVLRSVILAAVSQKRVARDSWLYRAFMAQPASPPPR